MKVSIDGQKRDLQIQTAGSTAGEQMRVDVDPKKKYQQKLDDLGMTAGPGRDWSSAVIPEGTASCSSAAEGARADDDALRDPAGARRVPQHIHTIERDQAADLEGITQNKIPSQARAGRGSEGGLAG